MVTVSSGHLFPASVVQSVDMRMVRAAFGRLLSSVSSAAR